MEEHAFQEAFRRKLHNYKAPVGPQEWNRLAASLNAEAQAGRRSATGWLVAACLSLLLVAGGVWTALQFSENKTGLALKTVSESAEKVRVASNNSGTQQQTTGPETKSAVAENQATPSGKGIAGKVTETATVTIKATTGKALALNQATENQPVDNALQNGSLSSAKTGAAKNLASRNALNTTKTIPAAALPSVAGSASALSEPALSQNEMPAAEAGIAARTAGTSPETSAATFAPENAGNGSVAAVKSTAPAGLARTPKKEGRIAKWTATPETPQMAVAAPVTDQPGSGNDLPPAAAAETSENAAAEMVANQDSKTVAETAQKLPADSTQSLLTQNALPESDPEAAAKKEPETPETNASRWQVAVNYSALKFDPNMAVSSYGFAPKTTAIQAQSSKTAYRFEAEREFSEETRSAYSWETDVKAGYELNAHFRLQTGLAFSSYATQTPTKYYLREISNPGFVGTVLDESLAPMPVLQTVFQNPDFPNSVEEIEMEAANVTYHYNYLGVPLEVQYRTSFSSRWNIFAAAGATINRLISGSQRVERNGQEAKTTLADLGSPFRKWQIVLNTDAGISYRLNQNLQLTAGLEGNYFLKTLAEPNPYLGPGKARSFGLQTGLAWQF